MSKNLRDFTKAVYTMDAVVNRVPHDAWDNDSPCEGWTARDVVGHISGVFNAGADMIASGEMVPPRPVQDVSDPQAVWASARDKMLAVLDTPDTLQREGKFWFGPMSVDQLISVVLWDPLTHAWDVGTATGVDPKLDAGLAQSAFDTVSSMRDGLAKMGLIAEATPVADDAAIVDRYLALVGRNPAG
jgi:uncharacterized protein (TIGR03086 family)